MGDEDLIPVTVAARVRPLVPKEISEGAQYCLQTFSNHQQIEVSGRSFAFDFTFGADSSQHQVYKNCAEPLLDKLFKGYNCTVFAYGQTGSGKTFTMGTEETLQNMDKDGVGIIPRMVADIFRNVDTLSSRFTFQIKCSMLEVYEERVLDLLADGKDSLPIREIGRNEGVFVQGLKELEVMDLHSAMDVLERGCQTRSKGETAMNLKSSRSHAVFTVFLSKTALSEDDDSCQAKLHLVDLAGSERLKKTQAVGERLREGIKINEGLLALGNVISALTDTVQQRSHIPYRDSKLTRLLQDSLGGNSYTVMLACVSPADSNCDETLSTLKYAERAKKIKNKPMVNQDPNAAQIIKLKQEVQRLTHELAMTRCGLASRGGQMDQEPSSKQQGQGELSAHNDRLRFDLQAQYAKEAGLVNELALASLRHESVESELSELKRRIEEKLSELEQGAELSSAEAGQFLRSLMEGLDVAIKQDDEVLSRKHGLDESDSSECDEVDADYPNKFAQLQKAKTQELNRLMREIADKQQMASQEVANYANLDRMKMDFEKETKELQGKVNHLESEKEGLQQQLRRVVNSTKLSEERRLRLAELEKVLQEHKKKLVEKQKVEKLKALSDENVKKLRDELTAMKQMRVKLVRQLKEESEKFRQWKLRHEREVNQLKQKEKKRQMEAEKDKRKFDQQLTVFRRKYEEAVATGKRLQQQLNRQTQGRGANASDSEKAKEQLKKLEQELDLMASMEEARIDCESLVQQRKELIAEKMRVERRLQRRRRLLQGPPLKKKNLGEGRSSDTSSSDELESMEKELQGLNDEIELRNDEIRELQTKVASIDVDKENRRWDGIHTISTAKAALKHIFGLAVSTKVESVQASQLAKDMTRAKEDAEAAWKEAEERHRETNRDLSEEKQKLKGDLTQNEATYQKAMATMLSALIDNGERSGKSLGPEVVESLRSMCERFDSLDKLVQQNEELAKELDVAKSREGKGKLFRSVASASHMPTTQDSEFLAPNQPAMKRSRSSRLIRPLKLLGSPVMSFMSPSDVSTGNDADGDSDYRETPDKGPMQRSKPLLEQPKTCRCRGDCGRTFCGCRKRDELCDAQCHCNAAKCTNRCQPSPQMEDFNPGDSDLGDQNALNATFVKAEPTSGLDDATRGITNMRRSSRSPLFKPVSASQ